MLSSQKYAIEIEGLRGLIIEWIDKCGSSNILKTFREFSNVHILAADKDFDVPLDKKLDIPTTNIAASSTDMYVILFSF
jgi:hypothetical protein